MVPTRRNALFQGAVCAAVLCCGLASRCPGSPESSPELGTEVGQMHPDFLLPALDGGHRSLSEFRGKKLLLLHFASW